MKDLTTDTFFNGRIKVMQPGPGYRFSIDAVLLAYHVRLRAFDKVLDLGCGCGIIPLILAYRHPKIKIYGVEVQQQLSDIANLNVEKNRMREQIAILCKDIKSLKDNMISGPVDLVVCNPPYRKAESGRINPDRQRAIARHEIKINLHDVIETVRRTLRTAGRFITIYPAERLTDMLIQMRSARIEPKFIRTIHARGDSEAKLILVEGIKGGRPGIKIGLPIIIYNKDRSYTDEVKKMFLP